MDKNTILAIALSTLVIIIGFTVQATFFPTEKTPQNATEKNQTTTTTTLTQNTLVDTSTKTNEDSTVDSLLTSVNTDDQEALKDENVVIETDLVRVEFSNRGGDIISYKLKKHTDKNGEVEMAEFVTEKNRAFSLILGDAKGSVVNQLFNIKKINDTTIGFYRTFAVKNSDGSTSSFTLAKQYKFYPDDYMFELKITIDGASNLTGIQFGQAAYTIKTSPQIGPKWDVKQDKYEYRRFYEYVNGKAKKITLNPGQVKDLTDKASWAGVAGKYFTLIALPEIPSQSLMLSTQTELSDTTNAQIFLTRAPITGNRNTDVWRFYLGPRTEKTLSKYNIATNNPFNLSNINFDQIVESSGILGPLEILLKWLMEFFYKLIPNWGVSIIILTVLMRFVIFPLTKKSSESSLKMQELQPRIQEIQNKYKNNTTKMNEEMAKFYKEAGYNPLSGCLPLLIQFPLIFAMYNLFNNYFEFRGALFIPGWIPDLSQGDSILTLPFTVPFLGWSDLRILPIIYVISQLLFGKVTQTPGTAQQNSSMKFMMYGMPLIFFFMFYNAPAGLLIYWTLSNFLTLAQQLIINKVMHKKKNQSGLKLVKK